MRMLRSISLPLLALLACGDSAPADPCTDTDACTTTCATADCTSSTTQSTSLSDVSGDPTSADVTTSSSSASTTTADPDTSSSGTTVPVDCRTDAECSAPTPHCSMSTCVACNDTPDPDGACAALDPDVPLCDGTTCVQCTARDTTVCTGTVPICDPDTSTCVGCSAHTQCPASACHFDEGSCLPEDRVWYVDGDADNCVGATGSLAAPYCTIAEALAEIGQASRGTIRIAAASTPYTEAIEIDSSRIVALMASEATPPVLDAFGAPTLTVDGATLIAERLRWRSNAQDPAIVLDDATAWIDRSEIVQNQGGGIDVINGALLHLRTSVIGAGGTGLADRQALLVDGGTIDVIASTIAGNDGSMTSSIRCVGGGGGAVRSSIVVGLDPPSISCLGLAVDDSAVDTAGLDGAGNTVLADFNPGWFVDAASGDFHLVGGTLFEDIGVWHAGDPAVDLDGDARPDRDGAVDVAGADVP